MKKLLFLLAIALFNFNAWAQPVDCGCTNCPVAITDNGNFDANIFIQNTGPNILGVDNCLQSVCFTVTHTWIGDLDFTLTAPDGTCYIIMGDADNGTGGCGTNCDNLDVCITLGTGNPAGTGTTEYGDLSGGGGNCVSGNYTIATNVTNTGAGAACNNSTNDLDAFNNGTGTVSGMWTLTIGDNCGLDTGSLTDWSLNFCDESGIDCSSTPLCLINNFTATIGACDPATGNYDITGQVEFTDEPNSGSLVIEDCNGTIHVIDNAPFPNNGTVNYNITGLPADGAACDITAYFTDDPACLSGPIAYTAPTCPCNITYLTDTIGVCQTGSVFDVWGAFSYSGNPGSGTVIVDVTNSSSTQTQVFNPPFVDGQLYDFNIGGNVADGSPVTVTVYFSDDISCTLTSSGLNSPQNCDCAADIGTFSTATQGTQSGNDFTLCWGQTIDITANGDYTAPGEATNPPGPAYTPGIGWLVYSCPPTVALTPDPVDNVPDDPCLEFFINSTDINDFNDQWYLDQATNNGTGGVPSNNTLYWVPITMYSTTNNPPIYSYVNTSMPCYETGPIYSVTYLDQVFETTVEDCQAGTVSTTINGGQPALDGSDFTIQNFTTSGAGAVTAGTVADGGTLVISGLVDGDTYSYDIVDDNGCVETITGTFVGLEDPAFTYPQSAYCADAANATPTITGDAGGSFSSSPAGLSISTTTGVINIGASTPGQTYTVTYTTPDPVCFASTTFDVTINPLPIVDGNDEIICIGGQVTLNGTGADTYTWDQGVVDGVPFSPGATTTFIVTGSITATGCSNTGDATVTVNPLEDPSFTTQDFCEGTAPNAPSVTGVGGGSFSFFTLLGDGAMINTNTGVISNGVGGTTYVVQYATPGACPDSTTQPITVNALPTVTSTDESVCVGGTVTLNAAGASTYTWSPGADLSATTGASVDFTAGASNIYTITGTDANGCVNTTTVNVTVIPNAPISAGSDVAICDGETTTITATGGVSYTWDQGLGTGASFDVTPSVTTTYIVNGTDANGCSGSDQVTITVNPLPVVDAGVNQTVCDGVQVALSGSGATSYTWNNGVTDGVAFTQPVGTVTYIVTGTDGNGCESADQVDVTVNPLPVVDAGTDQTVCDGVQVTLSGSGANTYAWDNGITDGVPFAQAVGTITYMVTGTDGNGCQNTDQVDVTVNPLPVVSGGIDQTLCDGDQVALSGSGATSYTWNNGVIDGVPFVQALGTITYTVTGTDVNGCQNTDQVDVTVNPNPTPTINGANEYCIGSFSTLSTSQPYTTYAWSTTEVTPTIDVTAGTYNVTVTNAFGCSGTSVDFAVIENSVITYNSSIIICEGDVAIIHGNPETVAGVYSQTFMLPTGCDSTSNLTLIVNVLPVVDAGVDQAVCDGVATTLTATGATSYLWDNGVTNGAPFTQGVGTITYTVIGTDANGCQNTDQVDVTVNALPAVVAGPDQVMCDGNQVTLAGSGATSYAWNNNVTDGVAFTQAVGTVTYTLIGTDANNCSNTDQVDVTINPLPLVDAGPDQSVCDGVPVSLSGSGANTYTWDNGVTNGSAFNQAIGTLTYTVIGTDANGCQNTDQADITVWALPAVNAGADQILCFGDQSILSGAGATSYTWTNGVSDGVAFSPSVGTTTYTVTGTDANGCVNIDQVDVTVNPLPIIDAGPDQTVCDGVQVTLQGNGAGAGGSYSWDNGVVDGVAFIQAVSTTTYTVMGTDANGCVYTDQVNVTVNPLPNIFAGNDFVVCEGDQAILTASGAGSGGTYVWDNNVVDGVAFVPTASNTYTAIGTDGNGCVNTDQVLVTVEPLPVVIFSGDNLSGCEPLTVTFTNQTAGNITDCIWSLGTDLVTGCGSITYTFNNPGTYDVSLTTTSANGCVNSATYTDYIYVEASPIAAFSPSSNTLDNLYTEVHFTNNSSGAVSYEWDFGDGSGVSTEVNPSNSYPDDQTAVYVVELIAYSQLGCTDTAYSTIQITEEVIFYVPNTFTPDNDDYNERFEPVFTSGFDPYDYTLLIFNRWGEILFESHNAEVGWDGTYGGMMVQDGTYTWKIEFKTTATDERRTAVGHVNVIR